MAMSDPLGDMLTRIRNGQMAQKAVIECPHSNIRANVCQVLADEGYIRGFKVVEQDNNKKVIEIELKYEDGRGVIRQIDRISRPGCRTYTSVKDMGFFFNGLGIFVISTPRGVMPDYKARAENIGGEVLCQVF